MPLYLEIVFTIIGFVLSIVGIFIGSKALINSKSNNKQKNMYGDNTHNSTINYGIKADELINIIRSLPSNDIKRINEEINKRIDELTEKIATRPKIHFGKDEPKEAKDGDLWFQEID